MLVDHFRFHDWGGKNKNIEDIGGAGGTSTYGPLLSHFSSLPQHPFHKAGFPVGTPAHASCHRVTSFVCLYCGPYTKLRHITHLT